MTAPDMSGTWRIAGWTLDRMVTELRLVAAPLGGSGGAGAAPGRATTGADAPHGPTTFHLLDLPPLDDIQTPRLWIAAAGASAGWRRAELTISLDGGASWSGSGSTAAPAIIGTALSAPGPGSAALLDRVNSFEVELLSDSMWLESRTDAALAGGANLAMLGEELIQFGSAEQTGPRTFRLSQLMRGRRGSEWAMAGHVIGERFVLIEAAALAPLALSSAAIKSVVKAMAEGVGDEVAVEAEALFVGRALRPPPPVRLSAERLGDGTVRIGWTRRSRAGWAWLDGGDAPLGEEAERYRLMITPSAGASRTVELGGPGYDYGAAEQAEDGSAGASSIVVSVTQLGSVAASLPAASGTFGV